MVKGIKMLPKNKTIKAFSLVELSIVLVILGLLVGGVLSGQSLIHAAEVRSTINGFTKLTTATNTFRDKYFGLPGDITNATSFWGTFANASCSDVHPDVVIYPGTCNGDGNGIIGDAVSFESFRAYQQLSNAGLIEGQYAGTPYFGDPMHARYNVMPAPFGNNVYNFAGDTTAKVNWISLGISNSSDNFVSGIVPQDAWNIDKKLDDGLPQTGRIQAWTGYYSPGNCNSGNSYLVSSSDIGCVMIYQF